MRLSAAYKRSEFIFLSTIFLVTLVTSLLSSIYWLMFIPFLFLLFCWGWQAWHLVFYLLIFCLPWSFEFNFNSSLGTDLPDEPLMLLVSLLFVFHFLFAPSESLARWKQPLLFLLFAHIAWMAITVFFSSDVLVSLKYLLAKGWYVIAFVCAPIVLFKDKKTMVKTGIFFLVAMLCVTILAMIRHGLSGFRFIEINNAVSPFFRNHVNYSAMLVCTLPVLVVIYQLNRKYRTLIVCAILLVIVALIFSYSRGAWLAAISCGFSYLLIKRRKLALVFLTLITIIFILVVWMGRSDRYLAYANDYRKTIFHSRFTEHLVATYRLKDLSTAERINRWVAGVRMVNDEAMTGFGPGSFYNNYRPYTIPVFRTWVSANSEHSTVHNYFLLLLIEQGIPGFLLFISLVAVMLYYSEKLYHTVPDPFYKAIAMACGALVTIIITVNFLSDLIESDKIGSLFFICLALLASINHKFRGIPVSQPAPNV